MSSKFFVLYGDKTVTACVAVSDDLPNWVRRDGLYFDPETYEYPAQWIAQAAKILQARYQVFKLFEYTPSGMAEFLEDAAAQQDELIGLHALEIAEDYIQDAQKQIALALTKAQQKAMSRVQLPVAGDKQAFSKYQEKIAYIRDLSIRGLWEYVENGDESPE